LGIKNAYLNSVLNLRFYLQTIHKRRTPKKIIMIKIKKKYKDKEKKYIPFKTTTKIRKSLQKAKCNIRGEEKWRRRETKSREKNEPNGGKGVFYMKIFPTELPTDINCCRWH
jgi:hypothetical protein